MVNFDEHSKPRLIAESRNSSLANSTRTSNIMNDVDDNAYEKYVPKNNTEREIVVICNELMMLLIDKNRAYGNSALDPVRTFSKADPVEQILVRIDDKLSRFARGTEFPGDNDIDDLLGYLVLLKVAQRNNWR